MPSPSGKLTVFVATTTLDLRGEVCPFTFVRTKLRLEELPVGAVLHVIVDHAPATRNVPRSVIEWGQGVMSIKLLADGIWEITIEKRSDA